MAELFRKTSLEKLSSPEQLDKMIVITPPSFWIAMLGVGGIVGAALLWSILGRLPVNVETQGIYLNSGDVYSLYADTTGVIDEVMVEEGDAVAAGDIIAYLDMDSIQEKLDDYDNRIQKVRAVTMNSENDVVTADNKNLIDIKYQLLSVDQTLQQDSALLKLRQEKLAEQRQKTMEAERKMRETEAAYYSSLNIPDTLAQQLSYSDAQSKQANASGYLESAYGNLDQAEIAYTQAQGEYDHARSAYAQAVAQKEALKADMENKKNTLDKLLAESIRDAGETGGNTGGTTNSTRGTSENTGGTTNNTGGTTNNTGGTAENLGESEASTGETNENPGESEASTGETNENPGESDESTERLSDSTEETNENIKEVIGDDEPSLGDSAQISDMLMKSSMDIQVMSEKSVELPTGYSLTLSGSATESSGNPPASLGNAGDSPEDDQELQEAQAAYEEAVANYKNYMASGAIEQAKSTMDSMGVARDAALSTKNNYQNDVSHYTEEKLNADAAYNEAKSAYIIAAAEQISSQADQSEKSNEYNIALSNYNTQQSTLLSLEDGVDQLKVQVEVDWEVNERQIKVLYNQFEAAKSSVIDQLKSERRQYESQKEDCTVRAAVGGNISAVSIVRGSIVQPGSELVKVKQKEGQEEVVICYAPLSQGKKVAEGMTVFVYPTTVNKQEYGHMEASVESIDAYVSSADDLRTQLGNDNLVESFLQNGPVVAITCRLKTDPATESGYYWSNRKGKDLTLMEGTLVEASVVVEEKAPISMLIPYLKEKFTVKVAEQ